MVDYITTANRLGVTLDDISQLMKGRGTRGMATRLGLTIADTESFISGNVTANFARRIELAPPAAVDELARSLGREGRIGLLVGLLLGA